MRLHPEVSEEEALDWLLAQAMSIWGLERTPDLEKAARPLADAMAAISATELPEGVEPLFP